VSFVKVILVLLITLRQNEFYMQYLKTVTSHFTQCKSTVKATRLILYRIAVSVARIIPNTYVLVHSIFFPVAERPSWS
jgi:hypothetical protein